METNTQQVVFKALLTLHQMMRSGSAETLLGHLSRNGDVLRLRAVQGGTDGGSGFTKIGGTLDTLS